MSVAYDSTVSGVGLIGATMTSTLQSSSTSPANDEFPLGFTPGAAECPAMKYLRHHERYLASNELLDIMRLPAIVLRGMLDNAALVLPVLMVLVTLTEVAYGLIYEWGEERLRLIPIALAALFALAALLQPVVVRFWPARITWVERSRYEAVRHPPGSAVRDRRGDPQFLLEQEAIDTEWSRFAAWIAAHHVGALLAGGAIVVTIM